MGGRALWIVGMGKVGCFYIFCGTLNGGISVSYIVVCYVLRMGGVLAADYYIIV